MKTCLVVDDSSVIRKVARRILEGMQFEISEAEDGAQALEMCRKVLPDAVLLDLNMPKMDGMTFLRALRRMELPLAATPVLVISTEAADSDAEGAREAGANFYLVKPVVPETLLAYVALLCGVPG